MKVCCLTSPLCDTRQESEQVLELKGLTPRGTLPRGALASGATSLRGALQSLSPGNGINSFQEAKGNSESIEIIVFHTVQDWTLSTRECRLGKIWLSRKIPLIKIEHGIYCLVANSTVEVQTCFILEQTLDCYIIHINLTKKSSFATERYYVPPFLRPLEKSCYTYYLLIFVCKSSSLSFNLNCKQ